MKHAAVKHSAKAVARQAKADARQARADARQARADARQPETVARQPETVARQPEARSSQGTSGEAAARRSETQTGGRRWLVQLPYCIVVAGLVAGLATVRSGGQAVKGGTLVVAGAFLAGSLIRLVLPDARAGMLASRRRFADVAVLGALGVGLLVAGLVARVTS